MESRLLWRTINIDAVAQLEGSVVSTPRYSTSCKPRVEAAGSHLRLVETVLDSITAPENFSSSCETPKSDPSPRSPNLLRNCQIILMDVSDSLTYVFVPCIGNVHVPGTRNNVPLTRQITTPDDRISWFLVDHSDRLFLLS